MRLRKHANCFFLACYAFFQLGQADSQCAISSRSTVSDACVSFAELDTLNHGVTPALNELLKTDFFAYYRLNLYKSCSFWTDENSVCGNRACAVDTIDDERDIPPIWRSEELGKLQGARAQHPGPKLQKQRPKQRPLQYQLGEDVDESCVFEADDECDERDYCIPEDEGASSKGDYVSLLNNTERFTGYAGPGARQVWDAIYKENCFSKPPTESSPPAAQLREVFQEYGRQNVDVDEDVYALDDQCVEQRAFYRIVSGMHASISTHLCWDYFNQTTGEWVRNVDCYKERMHSHPERVSNLYFNYALVTRAIAKLQRHLQSYTFCSGDPDQDHETKQKVLRLTRHLSSVPLTFDESTMFQDPEMLDLKDDFKHRFRNVSRIMDCVGCDKCRLWGKVQTAGYGAAMKVLFEFDETKNGENPHLRRTELVALVNTFGRLSHSMEALRQFRRAIDHDDLSLLSTGGPVPQFTSSAGPSSRSSRTGSNGDGEDGDEPIVEEYNPSDRMYLKRAPLPPNASIWQEFKAEFDLVIRAYKMVLTSWINLPFKISSIMVMELNRLWSFWLGLPVPGRSWNLHFPTVNELHQEL